MKIPKVFHIEAVTEDHVLIGTDIRATDREEAERIMKLIFIDKVNRATKFYLISEDTIH
tara:strand:- start:6430 stop:6606 length:177 start_codon:yes stop_codon:yes gene_type:complete